MPRRTNIRSIFLLLLLLIVAAKCDKTSDETLSPAPPGHPEIARIKKVRSSIVPFFRPMHLEKGDWLQNHVEAGQTFEQYLEAAPTLPDEKRRKIYVLPIGKFDAAQKAVVEKAAKYLEASYGLKVVLEESRALGSVPFDQKRLKYPKNIQIKTSFFLQTVLPPLLPLDAAGLICLTSSDLYPDSSMNFVFGQASLENRIGVWSIYRLAGTQIQPAGKDAFLRRTLKIAIHETGHMFSIAHCTKYECLMSGTNGLEETDRRPIDFCPECMSKIAWGLNYEPVERYKKLADFWRLNGDAAESSTMLAKMNAAKAAE